MAQFADRLDAGRVLAGRLADIAAPDAVVLGMARGGVVVGFAVARALHLALRPLIVRKLGAPHNPELAIGAVSQTGAEWVDMEIVRATGATASYIGMETARQVEEARRRQAAYAVAGDLSIVRGRQAIVTDDGIATGASALVALASARELGAVQVILAVPVASAQAVGLLRSRADEIVVIDEPEPFHAVGMHYRSFEQVSDEEVIALLQEC